MAAKKPHTSTPVVKAGKRLLPTGAYLSSPCDDDGLEANVLIPHAAEARRMMKPGDDRLLW